MSSLRRRAGNLLARLVRTLAVRRSEFELPLPSVDIRLGRSVRAVALNAAVAAMSLACATLLVRGALPWLLAVAGSALLALRPMQGLAQLYAAALGAGLALHASPGSVRAALLVLGAHAMVQLASVSQSLHWSTRVELRVLAAPARRAAAVQAFAQALLALGGWLSRREIDAVGVSVAAGLALAAGAWVMVGALSGSGGRSSPAGGRADYAIASRLS